MKEKPNPGGKKDLGIVDCYCYLYPDSGFRPFPATGKGYSSFEYCSELTLRHIEGTNVSGENRGLYSALRSSSEKVGKL